MCAPSGPIQNPEALERGLGWLEERGFEVCHAPHLHAREGFLAGGDDERLADLRGLLRDPGVSAIVFARGGYGLSRLISRIDPAELRRARKLLVGYSDATSLLLYALQRAGLPGIHGPMLERPDTTDAARDRLLALAAGSEAGREALRGHPLRPGRARGRLVGGNLTMLTASLGTPWEVDTRGAILFLEEVGEQPYALDRSLVQLREAGKLAQAAGVAIGGLVDCESERYPEISAGEAVRDALSAAVEGPVVEALPFGHVADNRALGFGVRADLDGARGTQTLLEYVVEGGN
ncbi:MAG: LD-carboxypeptidase [Proteobacteria bacterium]|nr:LD-carboxypeptidase [Pseudomonadota bacterium]